MALEITLGDSSHTAAGTKTPLKGVLKRLFSHLDEHRWVIGFFGPDGDLTELYVSDDVDLPTALNVLLNPDGAYPARFRCSTTIDKAHSVVLVILAEDAEELEWQKLMAASKRALAWIADFVRARIRDGHGAALQGQHAIQPVVLIVNKDMRVQSEWYPESFSDSHFSALFPRGGEALPSFLAAAVQRLIASWDTSSMDACDFRFAHPIPGLSASVFPVKNQDDIWIAVVLQPAATRRTIEDASLEFRLSRREREVLCSLFDGCSTSEIAYRLKLAESTVQDHIKRMIFKTRSRNRMELAAKIFGWPDM
ncbi:MAG: helix-turn-helix transcriptional regulator [Candidatus Eremiobacteraeota bacterium]|nr:helix-turn-helix transcriptional regulator [Candidatus Eremiobacteraeota bacterium]